MSNVPRTWRGVFCLANNTFSAGGSNILDTFKSEYCQDVLYRVDNAARIDSLQKAGNTMPHDVLTLQTIANMKTNSSVSHPRVSPVFQPRSCRDTSTTMDSSHVPSRPAGKGNPPGISRTGLKRPRRAARQWWLLDSDQRCIMHPVYRRAPSTTRANHL